MDRGAEVRQNEPPRGPWMPEEKGSPCGGREGVDSTWKLVQEAGPGSSKLPGGARGGVGWGWGHRPHAGSVPAHVSVPVSSATTVSVPLCFWVSASLLRCFSFPVPFCLSSSASVIVPLGSGTYTAPPPPPSSLLLPSPLFLTLLSPSGISLHQPVSSSLSLLLPHPHRRPQPSVSPTHSCPDPDAYNDPTACGSPASAILSPPGNLPCLPLGVTKSPLDQLNPEPSTQ